ncbi:acetyl-CoA synthetase-like protein [Rhizophagus irregularis]|uniref:Acetyl-CoA synthetase-like protein n=1 Tax=Rhizophagus irregularis TaxID=588596 RepID=A0A2N1NFG0_9GLOM|nr:acetyl-CoA synthetase-like protein [Rhizophagus irregularis]
MIIHYSNNYYNKYYNKFLSSLIPKYCRFYTSGQNNNYLPSLPLFTKLLKHAETQSLQKPVIVDVKSNTSHSYQNLVSDISSFRNNLLKKSFNQNLNEKCVAFLCPNGYDYVVSQWSIWSAGGIAVPLCTTHPQSELLYVLKDSQASTVITHPDFYDKIKDVTKDAGINDLILVGDKNEKYSDFDGINYKVQSLYWESRTVDIKVPSLIPMEESRKALIIYTSGTTGKPKGVVSTHLNIKAQVSSLIEAWRWSEKDRILHVLPLHHLHGILNALTCAIYAGATVEMLPKFDAAEVWNRWMSPERNLSLFMAVPTIYSKLIQYYNDNMSDELKPKATESCSQFRLMISGSAALPTPLRNTLKEISGGQILLERYGMSEVGMALSHEYDKERRFEGCVGLPLPNVQVRLISEDDKDVTNLTETPGEIQIKGQNVFKEYWNKPEATQKEFTQDGWFKTGDIAIITEKEKVYKILGRKSVDIIKSGGYKISALEIERVLLSHPNILDISVLGVEDPEWGQRIGAIIVLKNKDVMMDLNILKEFLKDRLAKYKIPSLLKIVQDLPKNAMGKVNKKELIKLFDQ